MRIFVAVLVGGLGVVFILAGFKGSGVQLFNTLLGKGTVNPLGTSSGLASIPGQATQGVAGRTAPNVAGGTVGGR